MQPLAIFLLPCKKDSSALKSLINLIATQEDAPVFPPHIKLAEDMVTDEKKLIAGLKEIKETLKPFTLSVSQIGMTPAIAKSLFITFKPCLELEGFQSGLLAALGLKKFTFIPHVTIMYKEMEIKAKKKIASQLAIPTELTFDRLAICLPAPGASTFEESFTWRVIEI